MVGNYDNLDMVNAEYAKIANQIPNAFIGFDGKYHVYIGPYLALPDLQSAYEIFPKIIPIYPKCCRIKIF